METRAPSFRLLVLPIAFTLVCVGLTIAAYAIFGGRLPFEPKGYRITVPVANASNLVTGSDVQIAGVPIGEVVRVSRVGNGAQAEIELKPRFAPLRTGARAIVRTKTLLGEAYLELSAGPRTAPRIPEGGRLPAGQVDRNVQLDEFLETFDRPTRDRMHELFAGLDRATDDREPELNDALGRAPGVTAGADELLRVIDGQRAPLGRLVADSADVLGVVGQHAGSVARAVRAGNEVLAVTARRERGVRATVRALPPFLGQLRSSSQAITAAAPDLDRAAGSLQPVAPKVLPALQAIQASGPGFREVLRQIAPTVAAGRRGLPALRAMLGPTRRGLTAFYPAARELIPIVELIAAQPQAPVGALANVANLTGGVFVGPGGLLQHYATGLPTVWNETIGGWKTRLPSNILNPYLKPGGLQDLADGGTIKAFDCRNTDNPNYLPPLGSAPPCILQGPWEFKGKSAFYPRLMEAPK